MRTIIAALFICMLLVSTASHASTEEPTTGASGVNADSMHISIDGRMTCDGAGQVEFTSPAPQDNFFSPRRVEIRRVRGQLSPIELRVVRGAAEDFIRDPAPFVSDSRITDQLPEITKVHVGDKARMSYVYGARMPEQLLRLYDVLALALKDAQVDGDPAVRDDAVKRLSNSRYLDYARAYPPAQFVIPNDDPVVLFDQLIADSNKNSRGTNFLYLLTDLEGTALGDKFLDFLQSHPKDLRSEPLLRCAILGGSTRAIEPYRALLDERFWDVPDDSLRQAFDADGIKALAAAIGEDKVTRQNALKAWEWLAKHPDRLRFDRNAHQYQIIGG